MQEYSQNKINYYNKNSGYRFQYHALILKINNF